MTTVPFGMKYPSYTSSASVCRAIPAHNASAFLVPGKTRVGRTEREHRPPAHHLLHQRAHVRQRAAVVDAREARVGREQCVDFLLRAGLGGGVLRHRDEEDEDGAEGLRGARVSVSISGLVLGRRGREGVRIRRRLEARVVSGGEEGRVGAYLRTSSLRRTGCQR